MLAVEVAKRLAANIADLDYSESDPSANNIGVGSMPDSPDLAIGIWPTGGPESSTKSGYDMRGLQVRTRGPRSDATTGYDLGEEIYDDLHGMKYVTLTGGTLVVYCAATQPEPVSIGEDESGRHEYTLNFRLEVRNPTANRQE